MAYLWTATLGLFICLGLLAGLFIHFVRRGLNPEDSKQVDIPDCPSEWQKDSRQ